VAGNYPMVSKLVGWIVMGPLLIIPNDDGVEIIVVISVPSVGAVGVIP